MKSIILELVFRSAYVLILYLGLYVVWYLSYGQQLEYTMGYFLGFYQSADFCFESSAWQWYEMDLLGGTFPLPRGEGEECSIRNLSQQNANHLHQSKSWSYLSVASVIYFSPLELAQSYASQIFFLYVLLFVVIQGYSFWLPGQLLFFRHARYFELIFISSSAIVFTVFSLYVLSFLLELSIEPLDSELITVSRA